jgi:hypothetical protein
MKMLTRVVVFAAVTAGLAITAAPAASAAPKGSCTLLTVSEVSGILGTKAGNRKSTNRTVSCVKNESCEWKAKKKGTGGIKGKPLSLELAVESGGGVVDDYQTQKSEDPADIEAVPGLGDDAFIEDLGLDLHVLVGDRVVSIEMHNYRYPEPLTQEQIQQKEQEAATFALGRLA